MKILLGSNSPRRKEILNSIKLPFKTINNSFEESEIPYKGDPKKFVEEIARAKAESLMPLIQDEILICGDTIVNYEDKVYCKPKDLDEAFSFIKELSGKKHSVYSGLCLAHKNTYFTDFEETLVTFKVLTDEMIATYFRLINPLDKAGGYAAQGAGCMIISKIEGCFYNVLGMPLTPLFNIFEKAGYNLWDILSSS